MDITANWLTAATKAQIFSGLSEPGMLELLRCVGTDIRRYAKGETVVNAGDRFGGMGVILEGSVAVQKLKPSGDLIAMGVFGPGQVFGENVVFSDRREWPATVTAVEACAILYLPADKIVGYCATPCPTHKQLVVNLVKVLSNRALMLNRKIDYLACKSLRARVAMFILEHRRDDAARMVELPLDRQEMADFLNIPRPSLSRELKQMKDDGLIDYHLNTVRIMDVDGLRAAVEG